MFQPASFFNQHQHLCPVLRKDRFVRIDAGTKKSSPLCSNDLNRHGIACASRIWANPLPCASFRRLAIPPPPSTSCSTKLLHEFPAADIVYFSLEINGETPRHHFRAEAFQIKGNTQAGGR
ncbi:MAG: hypothetical protein CM1200mP20_12960 [Pseudomonadota bacterium]|nr:MAG: hypothetical protein CM1200mP20_12960 [Pseudomonadota bacterium]